MQVHGIVLKFSRVYGIIRYQVGTYDCLERNVKAASLDELYRKWLTVNSHGKKCMEIAFVFGMQRGAE